LDNRSIGCDSLLTSTFGVPCSIFDIRLSAARVNLFCHSGPF
jgi:hypothetical protein